MNITEIKIRRIFNKDKGPLRAIVSITIDNELAIHDIKIVERNEKIFVAMPSRQEENGTFRDVVHPISSDARKSIECQILNTYGAYIEEHGNEQK